MELFSENGASEVKAKRLFFVLFIYVNCYAQKVKSKPFQKF